MYNNECKPTKSPEQTLIELQNALLKVECQLQQPREPFAVVHSSSHCFHWNLCYDAAHAKTQDSSLQLQALVQRES